MDNASIIQYTALKNWEWHGDSIDIKIFYASRGLGMLLAIENDDL